MAREPAVSPSEPASTQDSAALPILTILTPPVAWFTALSASYVIVPWACGSAVGAAALHLVSIVTLLAAAGAGVLAWTAGPGAGGEWPGGSPAERNGFLALLGMFSGALFALIILVQWMAVLILDPCPPVPRLPLSPHVLLSIIEHSLG